MPDNIHKKYGYLFIVTYGRSGSTLLQNVLNSIPGYEIMGENSGALFGLFQSIDAIRRTRKFHGRKEQSAHEPWYGADKLDPESYSSAQLDTFVSMVLQPSPGTRVTGFKEIRYLAPQVPTKHFDDYMNFLLTAFPDSRIIFNIRNTDDVLKSGWWPDHDQDKDKIEKKMKIVIRQFRSFSETNPRSFLVDYDKFLDDPGLYRNLFEFIEEDYDAAAVAEILGIQLKHIKRSD